MSSVRFAAITSGLLARKGEAQCDVMRAPGNQFIVPKVRLPQ